MFLEVLKVLLILCWWCSLCQLTLWSSLISCQGLRWGKSLTGGFKQLLCKWIISLLHLQEEKKFTKTVQGKVQSSYHHSIQEIGELLKKRLDTIKKLKIWEMHPWQTPQGSDTRVPDRSNIQYTITLIQNFLIMHEGLKNHRTVFLGITDVLSRFKLLYINQKQGPLLGFDHFLYMFISILQQEKINFLPFWSLETTGDGL